MSWGVTMVGTPEAIVRELDKFGEKLGEPARTEFEQVKPHLAALVLANRGGIGGVRPVVRLNAGGHAGSDYTNCNAQVSAAYETLCT